LQIGSDVRIVKCLYKKIKDAIILRAVVVINFVMFVYQTGAKSTINVVQIICMISSLILFSFPGTFILIKRSYFGYVDVSKNTIGTADGYSHTCLHSSFYRSTCFSISIQHSYWQSLRSLHSLKEFRLSHLLIYMFISIFSDWRSLNRNIPNILLWRDCFYRNSI